MWIPTQSHIFTQNTSRSLGASCELLILIIVSLSSTLRCSTKRPCDACLCVAFPYICFHSSFSSTPLLVPWSSLEMENYLTSCFRVKRKTDHRCRNVWCVEVCYATTIRTMAIGFAAILQHAPEIPTSQMGYNLKFPEQFAL